MVNKHSKHALKMTLGHDEQPVETIGTMKGLSVHGTPASRFTEPPLCDSPPERTASCDNSSLSNGYK
jgi:hypothetical protein